MNDKVLEILKQNEEGIVKYLIRKGFSIVVPRVYTFENLGECTLDIPKDMGDHFRKIFPNWSSSSPQLVSKKLSKVIEILSEDYNTLCDAAVLYVNECKAENRELKYYMKPCNFLYKNGVMKIKKYVVKVKNQKMFYESI